MADAWERLKNWFAVFSLAEMLVSIRKGHCLEGPKGRSSLSEKLCRPLSRSPVGGYAAHADVQEREYKTTFCLRSFQIPRNDLWDERLIEILKSGRYFHPVWEG